MLVAGIMSGTSADGVNVALAEIKGLGQRLRLKVTAHAESPFAPRVRRAILSAMNAEAISVAELARLNFLLGELYAEALLALEEQCGQRAELVGCHGQTLYHQSSPQNYLGRKIACTWQTGEGSVLSARVGRPVVSDFRPADMACGGEGAPLVPFLDLLLYRHPKRGRIVQNIGGIANLTALPAGARAEDVRAFDTGPGNMICDELAQRLYGKQFDAEGRYAAAGKIDQRIVDKLLGAPFFRQTGPKSAGREQFGRAYVDKLQKLTPRAAKADVMATALELTVESIARECERLLEKHRFHDYLVSGGGAKNLTLMRRLGERLSPLGLSVAEVDAFGLPGEAKEAAAFALLAYQTWKRQPSNVPAATGAKHLAILGKVSHV